MGELARFKARVLNDFVREHGIQSVIEFGCGDGMQLALAEYPRYIGIDVSRTAIALCRQRFASDATKSFLWQGDPEREAGSQLPTAQLALSLDVIYHLLEDDVYRRYRDLFNSAERHVIIYSSDHRGSGERRARATPHLPARRGSGFPAFRLVRRIDNALPSRSFADFYVFTRDGC